MNKKAQEGVFVFGFFIVIIGVILLATGIKVIHYNEYAFERHLGKLQPDVVDNGLYWKGIIGTMIKVNNQNRNHEIVVDGASKDLQEVKMDLNINMRLKKDSAYNFVKNYATEETYTQYLDNKIQERVKVVVLKYDAELFLYNRTDISNELYAEIKAIPELDYFEINDIAIKNIDFSDEFDKILERKAQVGIEREIIMKQKENFELINQNMKLLNMDDYFKYKIAEKWDGSSALTMVTTTEEAK